MNDGSFGFNGDIWVLVASAIFFAVMALVVYRVVRMMNEPEAQFLASEPSEDEALRGLGDRYERGEIDLETYQRLRNELDRR